MAELVDRDRAERVDGDLAEADAVGRRRFVDLLGSGGRLVERFGDLFTLERVEYLAPDQRFLAAVLRRKETG